MKLTVIGGGSSYTPELLDGLFARLERIPVREVCLMDVDEVRLTRNARFARRMLGRHGDPFALHATTDLAEAVRDARYVVTQIRVGQMGARIADEKLGRKFGIVGQETTGIGGFANALRTIPAILDVARAMEAHAPKGCLVNFTNPAGIVTEALIKHSAIRSVGLCNAPIGMVMEMVKHFGGSPEDVELDYVGLNHLSWVRGFRHAGRDRTHEALELLLAHAEDEWEDPRVRACMTEAMGRLGMYCNGYLQYFYATEAKLASLREKPLTRGEEVLEIERTLFAQYEDPNVTEKPEALGQRGGAHYSTAAFMLIDAMENDTDSRQIVCCRNDGAMPTFDDDVSVEVPAKIGRSGAKALPQGPPEPAIRGLMQLIKAYESLTVEAAVTGNRDTAYQAILSHPLTPDAEGCSALLDELLVTNRPWLGDQFAD